LAPFTSKVTDALRYRLGQWVLDLTGRGDGAAERSSWVRGSSDAALSARDSSAARKATRRRRRLLRSDDLASDHGRSEGAPTPQKHRDDTFLAPAPASAPQQRRAGASATAEAAGEEEAAATAAATDAAAAAVVHDDHHRHHHPHLAPQALFGPTTVVSLELETETNRRVAPSLGVALRWTVTG
jgi:hypothetical protein